MQQQTPIAVFAYNRPEHTERALASLAQCRRLGECRLIFYADGARSAAQADAVAATRRVLHTWAARLVAEVVERSENLGLAGSIAASVTDLCARYGRVIVVEDDLVLSPDFLHFMLSALDHYAEEPQVMQVAGCTLSAPSSLAEDAFLLPVTSTWGWATWHRAWKVYRPQPADVAARLADREWLDRFNVGGSYDFSAMLAERLAGRNDSWGILWWYAAASHHGLVAYPRQSLVWNGGFDGSGVHCGNGAAAQAAPRFAAALSERLRFPEGLTVAPLHLALLQDYFRTFAAADGSPLRTMARKLWGPLRNAFR